MADKDLYKRLLETIAPHLAARCSELSADLKTISARHLFSLPATNCQQMIEDNEKLLISVHAQFKTPANPKALRMCFAALDAQYNHNCSGVSSLQQRAEWART